MTFGTIVPRYASMLWRMRSSATSPLKFPSEDPFDEDALPQRFELSSDGADEGETLCEAVAFQHHRLLGTRTLRSASGAR